MLWQNPSPRYISFPFDPPSQNDKIPRGKRISRKYSKRSQVQKGVTTEVKIVPFHPILATHRHTKPIQRKVTIRNPKVFIKKAKAIIEMSAEMVRPPSFTASSRRPSFDDFTKVRKKPMRPKIPRTNPDPKGINPGPGLDSEPGPNRIDSRPTAIARPTKKRVLMRSYFVMSPPNQISQRSILPAQTLWDNRMANIAMPPD